MIPVRRLSGTFQNISYFLLRLSMRCKSFIESDNLSMLLSMKLVLARSWPLILFLKLTTVLWLIILSDLRLTSKKNWISSDISIIVHLKSSFAFAGLYTSICFMLASKIFKFLLSYLENLYNLLGCYIS